MTLTKTRNGKIARLPRAIRDQINQRIDDGFIAQHMIVWLNNLPEVRAVLDEHFNGADITPQNMSDWRHGGYEQWAKEQEAIEVAALLYERQPDLVAATGGKLGECLKMASGMMLAKRLQAVERLEESPDKTDASLRVVREVIRWRGDERKQGREERDAVKAARIEETARRARVKEEREMEEARVAAEQALAEAKLNSERLLTSHGGTLRSHFEMIREVVNGVRPVPAPVLEFFADEIAFERRHAAALMKLSYCLERREKGLEIFYEWQTPAKPVEVMTAWPEETGAGGTTGAADAPAAA